MLILALDTALDACSVAVHDTTTDRFLSTETEVIGKGHAERLMAMLEAAMTSAGAGFGDIDRLAVTIGPGSFTGIRVGLATARGIALAARRPVVGVSTLDAIAAGARVAFGHDGSVFVALDARRNEVYAAHYDAEGRLQGDAAILPVEDAVSQARACRAPLVGSGAPLLVAADETAGFTVLGTTGWPDIQAVARLGARAPLATEPPKPLYLRAPDAKPQTRGIIERIGGAA